MARTSRLSNADFAKSVAEAYINGMSRSEMSDMFGAHTDTISIWCRDPRVQAHASRFAQERVNRITRKVDREIESRLEDADDEEKMPTELLLKVRKEFLDRALKFELGKSGEQADTINEATAALEENPELARQLQEMVSSRGKASSE